MNEQKCSDVRKFLALGETDRIAGHLERCASCRREAEKVETLLSSLAEGASVKPPAELDSTVRAMIDEMPAARGPFPSPITAAGLAMAALLAMICGVASAIVEQTAADTAPAWVVLGALAYLVVCTVATVPVLLFKQPASDDRSIFEGVA